MKEKQGAILHLSNKILFNTYMNSSYDRWLLSALGPHFSGEIASWLAGAPQLCHPFFHAIRPFAHQKGQNPDQRGHDLQATRAPNRGREQFHHLFWLGRKNLSPDSTKSAKFLSAALRCFLFNGDHQVCSSWVCACRRRGGLEWKGEMCTYTS